MHIPLKNDYPRTLLPWLIRDVEVTRGEVDYHLELFPAFNYARDSHTVKIVNSDGGDKKIIFSSDTMEMDFRMVISSCVDPPNIEFKIVESDVLKGPGIMSDFTLKEKQEVIFIFRQIPKATEDKNLDPPINYEFMKELSRETMDYWKNWISHSTYKGRWREHVYRSALTLKLLTYEPVNIKYTYFFFYLWIRLIFFFIN